MVPDMTEILEPARTAPAPTRRERDVPVPDGYDPWQYVSGVGAQLAGVSNVIMQLSWPGVGSGWRPPR